MLQPTWSQTLLRIAYRLAGSVIAIAVVVVAGVWLPPSAMVVLAVVGLILLTWFLFSHQILSNAGGVMMTVAMTATLGHLDAFDTLWNVTVMVVVAATIVIAVSLPGIVRARRPSAASVLTSTLDQVTELLGDLAASPPQTDLTRFRALLRGIEISARTRYVAAELPDDDRTRVGQAADLVEALTVVAVLDDADVQHDDGRHHATLVAAIDLLSQPDDTGAPDAGGLGDDRVLWCAHALAAVSRSRSPHPDPSAHLGG